MTLRAEERRNPLTASRGRRSKDFVQDRLHRLGAECCRRCALWIGVDDENPMPKLGERARKVHGESGFARSPLVSRHDYAVQVDVEYEESGTRLSICLRYTVYGQRLH
jgi:hypothetical protein